MSIKKSLVNISNNPSKSFIQASFIESEKIKNQNFGSLFILTEINYPNKLAEKIVFIINQLLEKNYFLNEKIILTDQLNSLKTESIFESALVKTNRELLEFIDQEKISFNFKDLNIIVGLIYNDQIHFSSMGQNKSFLIRKTSKDCQVSDINPDNEEHEIEDLASGKIFSSIVSGELPNNSYTVFTNASLSQYLLNEDFIKILEELKLEGATEQIKNLLKKINNYSNFSGIIIKNFNNEGAKEVFKYSEANLSLTEKNTEKILKTPGNINKENFNKNINNFLNKINIFKYLTKPFKLIKKIKIKKETSKNNELPILNEKKSKIKKTLLILLAILLVALAAKLYFQKNGDQQIFEEKNASTFEEQILQKQNQIESSLLYNNEDKAKEIIEELRIIINSLTDKEKSKIKNYSDLEKKLEDQINQIQKMIRISEPKEIANFSIINQEADVKSISLSGENNKLYALDIFNKSIYSLDLNDNIVGKLSENDLIQGDRAISANNSDSSYFLTDNQVITIDAGEKITFNKINIDDKEAIKSFDVYNNRPYLVNTEKNQIIKYSKNGNEFSSPADWLKDNSNINPIGLAIDFSIYILNQDAKVFKYLEGKKEDFETENIDPTIESAETIRLSDNYIFLLDKAQKRLIVYNKKDGSFINQYSSDKFDNLKDLLIVESQKKAYLLNENKVYEVNLIL